jgi:hypothetical protein
MNNDLIINDRYHPEGALQIEQRVRERERLFAILTEEENLEKAGQQQKRTLLPPIKIFLNVLSSLVAG